MILAKIEQHSWDSPDRTLSSAIRKNRLIIFTGDEKQNGPVKTRVTCQCMVKRPFSLNEMQPDRYMPMPSVHYGRNFHILSKIMRHFCNLIQMFLWQKFWSFQIRYWLGWGCSSNCFQKKRSGLVFIWNENVSMILLFCYFHKDWTEYQGAPYKSVLILSERT